MYAIEISDPKPEMFVLVSGVTYFEKKIQKVFTYF